MPCWRIFAEVHLKGLESQSHWRKTYQAIGADALTIRTDLFIVWSMGRSKSINAKAIMTIEWSGAASRFTFLLSGSAPNWNCTFKNRSSTRKNSTCEKNRQLRNNFWEVAVTSNYPATTFRAKATTLLQNEANTRLKPFLWYKKILCYNICRKREKRFVSHGSLCSLKQAVGWRRCGLPSCRALPFYASGQQRQVLATRFLLFA